MGERRRVLLFSGMAQSPDGAAQLPNEVNYPRLLLGQIKSQEGKEQN
jgi:hypothetical protein